MSRKVQLYKIIETKKPKTIVETGTWNGLNAISMCSVALKYSESVHYYGFDLFEDMNLDEEEFNVKAAQKYEDVFQLLQEYKNKAKGFDFTLIKGNTRETLHKDGPWKTADLAFIDGGHSVETIQSDYDALKDCKTIVFDDYYVKDKDGNIPNLGKYGCNKIVENLNAVVMSMRDHCMLGGDVCMVVSPPSDCPYPVELKVQTRNCVENKQIHANIKYSTTKHDKWLPCCNLHDAVAIVVSAGESYKDNLHIIRELYERKNHYLFCVKTNHDNLISEGLVPFGCILLDPRAKIKRFITNPHPDVNYFAASIVHPSTIDLLQEHRLFLYNATVGAGEMDLLNKASDNPDSKRIISGGSAAATRAIPVMRLLGFYKMKFFGYDCCYKEQPENMDETTKNGHQKFWRVSKFGKEFWTSLELAAQVQDFENYFQSIIGDPSFEFEFFGDGIIPHMYEKIKLDRATFNDVFKAH